MKKQTVNQKAIDLMNSYSTKKTYTRFSLGEAVGCNPKSLTMLLADLRAKKYIGANTGKQTFVYHRLTVIPQIPDVIRGRPVEKREKFVDVMSQFNSMRLV